MVVCTVLGVTIERVAYRPLREAPSLAVLITGHRVMATFAAWWPSWLGRPPQELYLCCLRAQAISLFGGQLTISAETVVTIIACIVIMVVLIWFVNNTPAGHAMLLCRRIAAPPS